MASTIRDLVRRLESAQPQPGQAVFHITLEELVKEAWFSSRITDADIMRRLGYDPDTHRAYTRHPDDNGKWVLMIYYQGKK